MVRKVEEWLGKNDDVMPPNSVKLRICESQDFKCAITGQPLSSGTVHYDHRTPLWLGGENRESNIQAVLDEPHRRKTSAEATVRAKVKRLQKKRAGIKKPSTFRKPPPDLKFDWKTRRYERIEQ